jgi:hypothetical protein
MATGLLAIDHDDKQGMPILLNPLSTQQYSVVPRLPTWCSNPTFVPSAHIFSLKTEDDRNVESFLILSNLAPWESNSLPSSFLCMCHLAAGRPSGWSSIPSVVFWSRPFEHMRSFLLAQDPPPQAPPSNYLPMVTGLLAWDPHKDCLERYSSVLEGEHGRIYFLIVERKSAPGWGSSRPDVVSVTLLRYSDEGGIWKWIP